MPSNCQSKTISIVVPLLDECENVKQLIDEIEAVMLSHPKLVYELILVDDGSRDNTPEMLRQIQQGKSHIRVIEFRRNFGQTAAIAAGFDHARGDIIVPLDGDLQNDPTDIPKLIAKLEEGYDVVSGWRRHRKDKVCTRKIPSWIANWFIGKITGLNIHDYGCTIKAYRKEVVDHIHLYGEMHRFIPAIASWYGAAVTELEVNHRPRTRGQAKYGLKRTFKVVLDLITVKFLGSFSTKPLHIFGMIGMLSMLGAFLSGLITIYQKLGPSQLAFNRNPLLILTTLLIITGVQFTFMGLIAEMLARTYHESQNKPTYVVRQITQSEKPTWQNLSQNHNEQND